MAKSFKIELAYDPQLVVVKAKKSPSKMERKARVTFGAFTFGSQPGASGSGDMAYIVLRMQSAGQTTLNFQQTGVGDPQGNPLFLSSLEGSIISSARQLYLPLIIKGH